MVCVANQEHTTVNTASTTCAGGGPWSLAFCIRRKISARLAQTARSTSSRIPTRPWSFASTVSRISSGGQSATTHHVVSRNVRTALSHAMAKRAAAGREAGIRNPAAAATTSPIRSRRWALSRLLASRSRRSSSFMPASIAAGGRPREREVLAERGYVRNRRARGESGLDRRPGRGRVLCRVSGAQDAPRLRARALPRLPHRAARAPDRARQLAPAAARRFGRGGVPHRGGGGGRRVHARRSVRLRGSAQARRAVASAHREGDAGARDAAPRLARALSRTRERPGAAGDERCGAGGHPARQGLRRQHLAPRRKPGFRGADSDPCVHVRQQRPADAAGAAARARAERAAPQARAHPLGPSRRARAVRARGGPALRRHPRRLRGVLRPAAGSLRRPPRRGGRRAGSRAGARPAQRLLWMVTFFIAYRIFQDYVRAPWLMGGGIGLHPVLVIFGLLAGEQLGGITGVFLSIPVMAALALLARNLRETSPHAARQP